MPAARFTQQLRALILRDTRQMLVNPVGGGYVLAMLFFVLMLAVFLGTDDPDVNPLVIAMAIGTALATLTTTPTTFILSEEWEHGTFPPMLRAGTSVTAIVLARLIASAIGTLAHCAASLTLLHLVMPDFTAEHILPLTALCTPAAATCSAISLGLMLMMRSQLHIYSCCMPVLAFGLIGVQLQPLLGIPALELLPMSPVLAAALQLTYGIAPTCGWMAVAAASAVWLVGAGALLAVGARSFKRALELAE